MGSKKRRSKISSRNQINTEEIREKDGERKRKTRAILRGEEVANKTMMGDQIPLLKILVFNLKFMQFHIHNYNFFS